MKFSSKIESINLNDAQQKANLNANLYKNYEGVGLVTPVMFNPTQEELDTLGIKNIKLWGDDPYKQQTADGQQYTHLSLLFKFNPSELLDDETYPDERYGMYKIAISNDDLVEHKQGTSSDGEYDYYKALLIDEHFKVMSASFATDPTKMSKTEFREEVKKIVDSANKRMIFWSRKNRPENYEDIDLNSLSDYEKKRLFDGDSAMIQKQGYYPYCRLMLHISGGGFKHNTSIEDNIPFDQKEWNKLVAGNVKDLNKRYSTDKNYFYKNADGSINKEQRPKLGVVFYVKQNSKGYYNQEVLSPAYPGMNSSFTANFSEAETLKDLKKQKITTPKVAKLLGTPVYTCLDWYDIKYKLFGINRDNTEIDSSKAIFSYPFDMSFKAHVENNNEVIVTESEAVSNTAADDSDLPF